MAFSNISSSRSTGSARREERGFALLVTIVLVSFLVLILVGLATFTRVETQVAANSQQLALARQNALMALNIAIGELQESTGPDRRVTAPALATPSANVLTLGSLPLVTPAYNALAWDTFDNKMDIYWSGRSPQWVGAWRNIAAFPAPSNGRLVNWLVSGNEKDTETTGIYNASATFSPDMSVVGLTDASDNASALPVTVNGSPAVVLVGNYSVAADNDPTKAVLSDLKNYVVAPKVVIRGPLPDGTDGVIGHYAWWVGDQGTKASLSAAADRTGDVKKADKVSALSPAEAEVVALAQPARNGFEASNNFNKFLPGVEWSKVLTYNQVPFGPGDIPLGDARSGFHEFAAQSYGLLTDLNNGGFKVDLTEDPGASPVGGNLATYVGLAGAPVGAIATGVLKASDGTHPDINALSGVRTEVTHPFRDIPMSAATHPVVVSARIRYEFQVEPTSSSNSATQFKLKVIPQPELMLWNPYNADFTWVKPDGLGNHLRNGYRYRMRLVYDTNPFQPAWNDVEVSVGYRWTSGSDPALLPVRGFATLPNKINLAPDLDTDTPASPGADGDAVAGDVTIKEFLSTPPAAMPLGSTSGRYDRLRAGDVALYKGNPFVRGGSGFGASTVLDETVTLPNPNSAATTSVYDTLETAFAVHSETAAPVTKNVTLQVYARLVDETGADVADTSTTSAANPQKVREELIFSRNYALTFRGFDTTAANATAGDNVLWNLFWINAPNSFAGSTDILDVSGVPNAGATGNTNLTPSGTISLVVGSQVLELFNPATWNNHVSVDVRSKLTDEGLYQAVGAYVSRVYETGGGLPANTFGRLDSIVDPLDSFPILFEAPRIQPISVGELTQLQGGTNNPLLLGVDPNQGTGAVSTSITNLNYTQNTWDGFFFSTVPSGLIASDIETVQLPNTRLEMFKPNIVGLATPALLDSRAVAYLTGAGSRPPAAALRIVGPFNVNSPSIQAWASVLRNTPTRALSRITWSTASSEFVNTIANATSDYSRLSQAPGVGWTFRHSELSPSIEPSLYRNGFRELAPLDFYGRNNSDGDPISGVTLTFSKVLTQAMRVRIRNAAGTGAPFLNLGDFVNSGIIQTAIDNVPWTQGATTRNGLNWVQTAKGTWTDFSNLKGVPSYLSQRDIMKGLAPVLTARSDTFVIRTYGDVVNPTNENQLEGKAWCEALVQRETDYIDPAADDPEDTPAANSVNEKLGRRYRIIAFRWLGPNDI